jgi:hypothetical protein
MVFYLEKAIPLNPKKLFHINLFQPILTKSVVFRYQQRAKIEKLFAT